MKIAVGSTNPVKLNAVRLAAQGQWPDVIVTGFEVPSGVSEQPRSDEETRQGARNRAAAALEAGGNTTDLGLGLEGGIHIYEGELWSTVWVVLIDQAGEYYESNGARFKLPKIIADKLAAGAEMGPAVSQLFATDNIKQKQGAIGVITRGFVDRTTEYASIAKLALGLWFGRDWEQDIIGK
ncbi:MAG: inosine/xanthosine triphosphatase [bacterium]|nr:inosine/xanthosine triphosphatase [bacterium]